MLLPLVAIAATGLATFRSSVGALETFREETVAEATHIDRMRSLLGQGDDLGEVYVEEDDPAVGRQFAALRVRIDRAFDDLETLSTARERALASAARELWNEATTNLEQAAEERSSQTENALDPFHDHIDAAASKLAGLHLLNASQVGEEITSLRDREQFQLLAAFATLFVGLVIAGLWIHRLRRSITSPLLSLEEAAAHFGSDALSHRIAVKGDDELARVGRAFNVMAGKLRKGQEELRYRVLHDSLTGLPNRTLFMERMEHAIAREGCFSILYVDLDGFKAVNDRLGHEAGDELLIAVARRLRECLRGDDIAARLGGDEFGVLLEGADAEHAGAAAERLARAFNGTVSITAGEVPIGLSIGVATRQADEGLDELIRQADAAMYAAKARGTGLWQVFGPDVDGEPSEASALRTDLQHAIQRHEFVVHYQPIVRLEDGSVEAVEALVRWEHPERGLLAPAEFLQIVEENGQILFIDRFVMHEACRQVRVWQSDISGAADLSASVNVSARQLQHPGFAEAVAEALVSTGLPAEYLVLEITETALISDIEQAATELRNIKALGVRIALDDFGTGFSSLSHVLRFPVDIIKIDCSFISALDSDDECSDLALALVTLSKSLGLETVAEGIEHDRQLERLRSVGCDLGQGFLLAEPMTALQLEQLFGRGGLAAVSTLLAPVGG
jgi:diguanylate cyclase (GGDEF)-like protein